MTNASDYSGYGNEVLYRMCREQPLHNNIDFTMSKLWIVGRSYSAAIERKAGKDFKIKTAAEKINSSDIDFHIKKLQDIDRISTENVDVLLAAHKYLTDKFREITSIEKRSLASKYLHFHAPKSVFIYDSIASKNIRKLISQSKRKLPIAKNFDNEYEAFVHRCIYYRDNELEQKIGVKVTPRRLDMELLGYGPTTYL